MHIGDITTGNYTVYIKKFSGDKNTKPETKLSGSSNTSDIPADIIEIIESNPERMRGMCLHGRTDTQKTIDVSTDVREKLINLTRKNFMDNYGMSDGEEQSTLTKQYLRSIPESDRLYASNTLNELYCQEAKRLQGIAKERISGWEAGQPFDRSIFADVIFGGIDKKI